MTSEEHRPSPDVAEQARAGFPEELTTELRAGADSPAPGPLLVRGFSAWNRPECSAGALAMATLIGDDRLRREVRRDAADRGHPVPRWLAELHRAEPVVRAVELSTVFRDVDELVVGVTVPGGHSRTAVIQIDDE